ncbi:MAG: hypothetical protein HYZ14_05310 [Bacteroidetes bacterium]|nr:hypothetical protein [Bacteroidota bacterium]
METERLKFTIDRFDHYYESVNNKCNIVLGFSTFVLAGLIALYPSLTEYAHCDFWVNLLLGCFILLSFVVILIIMVASIPHLTKKDSSLFYFLAIDTMGETTFLKKSQEQTPEEEVEDMRRQTFLLACGLNKKFKKLRLSLILVTIQFVLLVPFILLIISRLK